MTQQAIDTRRTRRVFRRSSAFALAMATALRLNSCTSSDSASPESAASDSASSGRASSSATAGAGLLTVAKGLVNRLRENAKIEIDGQKSIIIGAGRLPLMPNTSIPSAWTCCSRRGPHYADVSQVGVDWSFTAPSSRMLVSDVDGSVTGQLGEDGTAIISLDAGSTVRSFFVSGVDHVCAGPDHLLFLVVLTFAVVGSAVSRTTTWRVVKLVTAFTIGHAVSLRLAYFDVVSIPAAWVEPAIALSIVVAAVLAIRGKGDTIRPWLAALVGLVHGLGFASSLSSVGLLTTNHASALAGFNIGIDVAQSVVVLLMAGAIFVAGKLLGEHRSWFRIVICAAAGIVGLVWTFSRVFL